MKPEAGEVWEMQDGLGCYLLLEREPSRSGTSNFAWKCMVLIEDPEWPDESAGSLTWLLESELEVRLEASVRRGPLRDRSGEVWILQSMGEEIHCVFRAPEKDTDGNDFHPTINLYNGHVEGLYEKDRDVAWELDYKMERIA